jgi:hypothetical protein
MGRTSGTVTVNFQKLSKSLFSQKTQRYRTVCELLARQLQFLDAQNNEAKTETVNFQKLLVKTNPKAMDHIIQKGSIIC